MYLLTEDSNQKSVLILLKIPMDLTLEDFLIFFVTIGLFSLEAIQALFFSFENSVGNA